MAFRLEYVRCGKPNCHCATWSPGHGPYWYEYWREGHRTRKRYVGKHLRDRRRDRGYRDAPDPMERWAWDGRMTDGAALRILGLRERVPLPELKARWRALVAEHRPDIGGDGDVCAAINAAHHLRS